MMIELPGAIVFASGDLSRYAAFEDSLLGVIRPPGTIITRGYGSDLVSNLNTGIEKALEGNPELAWVWIIADDHDFHPHTLLRLLSHNRDVMSPLVLVRRSPFPPAMYLRERDPDTGLFQQLSLEGLPRKGNLMVSGENGVPEFYSSAAGMLLSRKALDAVGPPWFETGRMIPGYVNEDLWLNEKLHAAGFRPAVDLRVRLGHITPTSIWPKLTERGWEVDLRFHPYQIEDSV